MNFNKRYQNTKKICIYIGIMTIFENFNDLLRFWKLNFITFYHSNFSMIVCKLKKMKCSNLCEIKTDFRFVFQMLSCKSKFQNTSRLRFDAAFFQYFEFAKRHYKMYVFTFSICVYLQFLTFFPRKEMRRYVFGSPIWISSFKIYWQIP